MLSINKWMCVSLMATTMAISAYSETYYVAVDGKPENDGTIEKPWHSVEYALSQVGGGHNIIVRPGIYRGPIQIPKQYSGTQEQPTTIKSEIKWQAVIIGSEYHVISNGDGCDWVVIDGFEVMGGRYDGVKMNGNYNVVRNCWVHNNKAMGVAMHNKKGGVIENNLIEFNGDHIQFDHGVYADGEDLTFRYNIIRHNASYGLQLYPSIKNSVIAGNIVYGQVRNRGIIVSCPDGGGKNMIINNTIADDQGIAIWNGDGEVIANNIMTGTAPVSVDNNTKNIISDYNLCMTESEYQGLHGIIGDPRFVDPGKGVYWLREDSPARGKGSHKYASAKDFWGRSYPENQPIDIGAFPYVPFLSSDQARAGWDNGWAYHRHGSGMLYDFWTLPELQKEK